VASVESSSSGCSTLGYSDSKYILVHPLEVGGSRKRSGPRAPPSARKDRRAPRATRFRPGDEPHRSEPRHNVSLTFEQPVVAAAPARSIASLRSDASRWALRRSV